MHSPVLITGVSCVSPFGIGPQVFTNALVSGASGVGPIALFDTSPCGSHLGAVIRGFDPAVFIPPLKLRRIDAVGRLALGCVRLLFDDAKLRAEASGREDTGVAFGTYTAGLDSVIEYLDGLTKDGPTGVPALIFSNTVSNAPASLCAIELALRGPNVTLNQREASSLAAIAFAMELIRNAHADAMLCGGADRLQETFFKVHDRFGALSPMRRVLAGSPGAAHEEGARPFDCRRNGYVLGEGGFMLLLESARAARQRGARVYGEVLGTGIAASKTGLNAWPPDGIGLARAMRLALEDAALGPEHVDALFAAASGSPQLDRIEADAITDVFRNRRVPVSSIKGAAGESSAMGAAAVIAGLLTMPAGVVPPTSGFSVPDPACPVSASSRARRVDGTTFMVNSVGAGGTNCSVVVRAHSVGHE